MLDLAIAAEELTCVDVNVPTTLLGTGLGLQPVIQFGLPEQKERFLRPFADDPEGDLLASYAFTDVAGGAKRWINLGSCTRHFHRPRLG